MKIAPQNRRRVGLLVGLGAALVLYLVIRGRSGGTDEALELAAAAGPPPGMAFETSAGGASGVVDVAGELASFVSMTEDRLARQDELVQALGVMVEDYRGSVVDLEDFLKSQGNVLEGDRWYPPEVDPDWFPPTDDGPSGQEPTPAPGNTKAAPGFFWNVGDKRTRVTRSNVQAFLAELRRDGVDPRVWAQRHPTAAKQVGLWPPASIPRKPPPKRAGGRGAGRSGAGRGTRAYMAPSALQSAAGTGVSDGRVTSLASVARSLIAPSRTQPLVASVPRSPVRTTPLLTTSSFSAGNRVNRAE